MFPSTMWGSQAETQRWALEIKPKGFRVVISLSKQEIKLHPDKKQQQSPTNIGLVVLLRYYKKNKFSSGRVKLYLRSNSQLLNKFKEVFTSESPCVSWLEGSTVLSAIITSI